ncbi:MAG: aromatic ring-hydroxylating dioxygenase subunit alpha [Myxococcota bacterium]
MSTAERAPELPRSNGISYQELLDTDTHPVPKILREQSPLDLPPTFVPVERYVTQEYHDLEMEKLWSRVWQFACREEEIPEAGDHVVYDIGDFTILIVRNEKGEINAFHNVCRHRGRQLREHSGRVSVFRCPFHRWTWNLDGTLAEIPCRWDFPHVEREKYDLPSVNLGTWGGFVFINLDSDCEPLEDFLGDLPRHFEKWPLENKYKAAHVARVMNCNWKVAQEAFMEAYHVIATHPQLTASIGDANSQYDVWENFSRAITPNGTPSPHLNWDPTQQEQLDNLTGRNVDGPPILQLPEGMGARELMAQAARMQMQAVVPGVNEISDAELNDSFYYSVFPNFHPWAAFNRIVYRFRPLGNDPNKSLMECLYLQPFRGRRPKPAEITWLTENDDWTEATELGFLSRVFNQDTFNLPKVQKGLRARVAAGGGTAPLANYEEAKIRHFHHLYEKWLGLST